MAEHNDIGKIGENITRTFLMKHGFTVLEMNYRTRYGELDIIAEKDTKLRFVEVKSVKVRDFNDIKSLPIQPEDNFTLGKWRKMVPTVEMYLKQHRVTQETLWQIDLACVYINTEVREGRVVLKENVHKEV